MYSTSDLRKGLLIQLAGEPYKIIEFQHKSLGRGSAVVNTKLRNLIDGTVKSQTFKGNDKIESAEVRLVDMQFLYKDAVGLVFMNTDNYEQITIPANKITDDALYLKEGEVVIIQYFDGKPIGVNLPPKVELRVVKTTPAIRGDTAKAALKNATLETGLVIQAPLFIKEDDTVRVDTRTGEYIERV